MTSARPRLLTVALVALVGCAEASLESMTNAADVASETAETTEASWVVEVYPPDESDEFPVTLLAQRYVVNTAASPTLILLPPVRLAGDVTGWFTNPTAGFASPPGTDGPVAHAEVTVTDADGFVRSTVTDDLGQFALDVVPGPGFEVTVRHDDPRMPPYRARVDVTTPLSLDVELGYGAAIWGHVEDDLGEPLAGVTVYAVDDAGLQSGIARTDDAGFYVVQVTEGSWQIVCEGRDDGRDPVLTSEPVDVGVWGAEQPVAYADLDAITVGGRVTDADGDGLSDVLVRFTAVALDAYPPGTSLVVEVPTTASGNYDTRLIRGVYDVEFLPEPGLEVTPLLLENTEIQEDLDDVALEPFTTLTGSVVDPAGRALDGAAVEIAEVGFGGRSWSGWTDPAGAFQLHVPETLVEITVSPPGSRGDLALTRVTMDPRHNTAPQVVVESGDVLTGDVRYLSDDGLQAVPYAWLEVRDDADRLWSAAITDEAGTYEARVADPGR